VADAEAGAAAGEAAVGDEGAGFAEALGLEVAGGVEHLLHDGAAARAFVADEDDIAGNDAVAEDGLDGFRPALGLADRAEQAGLGEDRRVNLSKRVAVVGPAGWDSAACWAGRSGSDSTARIDV
jgi:hypothetical protein